MADKASTQGGNMGSTGSMNRSSPLLAGMASAKPTWQGSPHKSTQPAGNNSEWRIYGWFLMNITIEVMLALFAKMHKNIFALFTNHII